MTSSTRVIFFKIINVYHAKYTKCIHRIFHYSGSAGRVSGSGTAPQYPQGSEPSHTNDNHFQVLGLAVFP
jgi:hypothetical protein